MKKSRNQSSGTPLPLTELAAPARRALAGAGFTTIERIALASEAEIKGLHGIGPNALTTLRAALKTRGLSFANK